MTQNTSQTTWASVLGALAVILGAFGAHGLKASLELHQTTAIWQTAANYHLVHSAVLLALGLAGFSKWGWRLIATGVLIFSGTLYLLSVTGIKWLGAITPMGGVCLIVGWAMVAVRR